MLLYPPPLFQFKRVEKYIGDALLQKSFTVDYLTKKKKMNEGEIPQYYVRDDHELIIPRDVFELVQEKLKDSKGKSIANARPLSGKIYCGRCGSVFGSKVWHSTDKYRAVIWQCNVKYLGDGRCHSRHVTETEIREAFLKELKDIKSPVSEFDEKAFERLVERMVVRDERIEVVWKR